MSNLFNGVLGQGLSFLLGLIPLILVHEFGHFLMARKTGVWAKEFGIGYPPRILKLFRWKETDFTLNWLPIGGFVRMEGESLFEERSAIEEDISPEELQQKQEARKHSLYAASPGNRVLIYLAGPVMNLLLAWALAVLLYLTGVPAYEVVIDEIVPNSPAAGAEMQVGDVILAINEQPVEEVEDVSTYIQASLGQPTTFTVRRDGETVALSAVPRANPPQGEGSLGILVGGIPKAGELLRYPLGKSLNYGTRYVLLMGQMTLSAPIMVIRGLIPLEMARPVGIVGISQITQQSVQESFSAGAAYPIMNILILLSLSLAIFNLLPIPPLDGGHILFIIVEKIRRKPLTPAVAERIYTVAFMVMLAVFVLITALDIFFPVNLTP